MLPSQTFPMVEEILTSFTVELAADYSAYRNHICRELHFFLGLTGLSSPPDAVLVAAAFHDLGIALTATSPVGPLHRMVPRRSLCLRPPI
jgi:hypothetical protein